MIRRKIVCLLFFCCALFLQCWASKSYYEIRVFKEISATSWQYLKNGLEEASENQVDAVFLHLNTYGGAVDYADSMRTAILNYKKPVYVFIDNNAASAGALISIACDSIYMRQGANIGAATVVNGDGSKAPDKYQSYMRSIIRSTAESQGKVRVVVNGDTIEKWRRDPKIAEAMVDESVVVPGVVDSTKILTFTANDAVQYGYCEGIYESIDEIIVNALHEPDYQLSSYEATAWDDIKGWLMNPVLHGVLIMLIIGGIYFEMQSPGIGFALAVSIVAAILYFAPLYIDGLADIWEGLLILLGVGLVLVEIFLIPGFGITGILGIVFVVAGFILCLLPNDWFSFKTVSAYEASIALLTVLLALIGSGILVYYLSTKIGKDGIFKNIALNTSLDDNTEVEKVENSLVGQEGITVTVLCPSGKVKIGDDVYNAVSENGGYVEEGTIVVVRRFSTGQLYVKQK